jgi:hypothetical protein
MSNHIARVPVASIAVILVVAALPPHGTGDPLGHPRSASFVTERTFLLPAGRVTRAFTLQERRGVILLNRLSVPRGVRAFVDATIPGVAGARVTSWPARNDPSLSCWSRGSFEVCSQGEEWCPMPRAVWRFRLVKLSGPAGQVRFDYVVAPPPSATS